MSRGTSENYEKKVDEAGNKACSILRDPLFLQSIVGLSTGTAAGFHSIKVGDWVAIAIGGTVFVLAVANHAGVIDLRPPCQSDKEEFKRMVRDTAGQARDELRELLPDDKRNVKQAKSFILGHAVLAGSFAAGIFIGRALA